MTKTITLNHPHLLIVEGKEDVDFFTALCKRMKIESIQLCEVGGKTDFRNGLETILITPGFEQVKGMGIVRDADDSAVSAFQSICGTLHRLDLPVPTETMTFIGDVPTVGVMILPTDGSGRMLEDVLLESMADDRIKPCVESYFDCLQNHGVAIHANSLPKEKVYVYIAGKLVDDEGSTRSDRKRGLPRDLYDMSWWSWDHAIFDPIKQFLRDLTRA